MRKSESRGLTHAFWMKYIVYKQLKGRRTRMGKQKKTTASPLEEVGATSQSSLAETDSHFHVNSGK